MVSRHLQNSPQNLLKGIDPTFPILKVLENALQIETWDVHVDPLLSLFLISFVSIVPFHDIHYIVDIMLMRLDGQSSRVSEQVQHDFQPWHIEARTTIDLIDNIPQSFPISPNITTITHFFLSPTFRVRKQSFPMPLSFLRTEQNCYIFSSPFRNTWLEIVRLIL